MALFGGNKKEEKAEQELQKYMKRFKLEHIDENDRAMIKEIVNDLAGSGLMKASMALSFAKAEEQTKVALLSALVKQNWIIIRKLDKLLEK